MTDFDSSLIEGRSYSAETLVFMVEHACTPRDVTRHPESFSAEVVETARFLDAWDVWMYSDDFVG